MHTTLTVLGQRRRVEKPWGHELVLTEAGLLYAGKLLHVEAGKRLSLQLHEAKTETLVLLSGSAILSLEVDGSLIDHEMEPLAGYTVEAGRLHRLRAVVDSLVMEVSTPEQGRTIRLEDDYGRPDEMAGGLR